MSIGAIALAKRRFPRLCPNGLHPYPGTSPRLIDPAQVEAAIAFLSMLTPTRTARIGSGILKHDAERWAARYGLGSYVSRGAILAAAVALGLTIRRRGASWAFNSAVAIGVSLKDLRRINCSMLQPQRTPDDRAAN